MFKLIGAEDIIAKGVATFESLRPVLGENEAAGADFMAHNATLRKNEWEMLDQKVTDVMRDRLTIADDMRSLGLIKPVSLGTILRVTERIADFDDADINFDGDTAGQKDRPDYVGRTVIPVPVIHKDFSINWRQLDASRRLGEPLDVTAAGIATRKVRDRIQKLIANGFTGGPGPGDNSSGGTSIPGLTTASNRIRVTLGNHWDASNGDPVGDTERMLAAAYAASLFGPFYIYVPKGYWASLQKDYILTGGNVATQTYLQRLLAFVDVKAVRPLDSLAADNVVMVQMTEDVLDYSEAQVVTTVQWEKNPFVTNFRVLQVGGPHIKDIQNQAGNTINGIIHLY